MYFEHVFSDLVILLEAQKKKQQKCQGKWKSNHQIVNSQWMIIE